jgi:putative flippase GtrA
VLIPILSTEVRSWIRGFVLHVITGFVAVAAHYSLMWLVLQSSAAPVAASSIGFLAGALVRFRLSYTRVFAPTIGVSSALIRFVAALGMQMAANALLLALLIGLGIDVWLAQVAVTVLLTVANYLVYRLWVFR